jgi:hypothetical protein
MTPAQAITRLRRARWTYRAIADAVGTVHTQPLRWERGDREPPWSVGDALIRLAAASANRRRKAA